MDHVAGSARAYEMSRYRQHAEPPCPPQPPSSQAEVYGQVPKTHCVMTLADHISVRSLTLAVWAPVR